jgi:hypothetical protein
VDGWQWQWQWFSGSGSGSGSDWVAVAVDGWQCQWLCGSVSGYVAVGVVGSETVVKWTVAVDSGSWQVAKWTAAMAVAVAVSLSMLYHISFHQNKSKSNFHIQKTQKKSIFILKKPKKIQFYMKITQKKSVFLYIKNLQEKEAFERSFFKEMRRCYLFFFGFFVILLVKNCGFYMKIMHFGLKNGLFIIKSMGKRGFIWKNACFIWKNACFIWKMRVLYEKMRVLYEKMRVLYEKMRFLYEKMCVL